MKYGLVILQQCSKRVKIKRLKVLGANSYFGRSYREKTGLSGPWDPGTKKGLHNLDEIRKILLLLVMSHSTKYSNCV